MPADEEAEEVEEAADDEDSKEAEEIEEVEDTDEVEAAEEPVEDEASEEDKASNEQIVDVNAEEEVELDTVGDAIDMLQEYDDDMRVEFEAVRVDGKEYPVEKVSSFIDDDGEKEILVLGVDCGEAEDTSDDTDEDIKAIEDDETPVETIEEVDDGESEEADDDGDEEVIESLKEMVRQKEALETEVSELRKAKTVGDAKEQELQEKLNRYRTAFKNTSAEAAKVPELQAKIQELTEKLTQSKTTIKTLTEKVNNARQLKESVEGSKATERRLNEEVSRLTKKSATLEAKLEGQTKLYTEKLQERTNLAKAYKARFIETLTRYVESKASMLGVQPSEITSRLNENYTLADVDAVCDQILDSTVNFGRLPFGGRTKTSARIAESVSKPVRKDPEYGYDIDDSLLELAGLKK
jgi:S-DNA-T family DNA segregation ATPase FtsK/SpoIIIE